MALSTRTQIKQKIKKEKRMGSLIGREDTLTAVGGVGYQTASDVNALIAQYLIDNPVGGDVIKSIQRGATSSSGTNFTATIASVDITKSVLSFSCRYNTGIEIFVSGQITNATTLTFRKQSSGGTVTVEWQVVEYN